MAKIPADSRTMDLLSWQPKPAPKVPTTGRPAGHDLAAKVSRAVAEALRETNLTRDEIAERMSAYLEEQVTKAMLDAYASQARGDHNISFHRLIALAHTLERPQLLEIGASAVDCVVVDQRWVPAIEEAMLADEIEELNRRREQARRKWRGR